MGIFGKIAIVACILLCSCKKEAINDKNYLPIDATIINNFIRDIIDEINDNYADEITKEKLEEGAINGMLAFLDEHSVYISQEEVEAFRNLTRGEFLGIGIEMKQLKEGIEVFSVIEDSPAMKAGIKIADVITHIDNKEVASMTLKEIISKLSSDISLKINLSVIRNKTDRLKIELKKTVIQMKSVITKFLPNIAIIKITYFNEGTTRAVKEAIKETKKRKEIIGVIMDLRGNPGGILDQAIATSSLFLDSCKVVEFKSRKITETKTIYSEKGDALENRPMAVLIDKNSASGAELMTAALGENRRAVVIGERSFGKGSLQTIIPIPGRGAIKLTTAYLFSPLGNPLNQNGVSPNIIINSEAEQNNSDKEKQKTEPLDTVTQRAVDLLLGISALKSQEISKN
jgi:carboxyl-terminal processing protease